MTTTPALVSVVIPTYQRREAVRRLLHALSNQSMAPDLYEVIVSIDGSNDGTREMVDALETSYALRALWQPNRGRAAACNAGIHAARGELIVLLDDDMEPVPEFLQEHINAHEQNPCSGVVGAVPVSLDERSPPAARYIGNKFNEHLKRLATPNHEFGLRDFYSGNFSIRRDVMVDAGGFDEEFNIYGNEDLELSLRLTRTGIRLVYSAEAVAHQHYTKDFSGLARDNLAKGRTAVLFASKHPEALRGLKLSSYRDASRKWRVLRSVLLGASRMWPAVSTYVEAAVRWRERRDDPRLHMYYTLALDYFYWLGARQAIRANSLSGHGLTKLPGLSEKTT